MKKCSLCGKEGLQRIRTGNDRFCSRSCMIQFGIKNNPKWINSEYYRMCLDESTEEMGSVLGRNSSNDVKGTALI